MTEQELDEMLLAGEELDPEDDGFRWPRLFNAVMRSGGSEEDEPGMEGEPWPYIEED